MDDNNELQEAFKALEANAQIGAPLTHIQITPRQARLILTHIECQDERITELEERIEIQGHWIKSVQEAGR